MISVHDVPIMNYNICQIIIQWTRVKNPRTGHNLSAVENKKGLLQVRYLLLTLALAFTLALALALALSQSQYILSVDIRSDGCSIGNIVSGANGDPYGH